MKKLILIGVLVIFGWQAYTQNQAQQLAVEVAQEEAKASDSNTLAQVYAQNQPQQPAVVEPQKPEIAPLTQTFTCDGRIHCSQMTSCDEATYFLKNCPGTKMDGDFDGIACEQQWCN